MPIVYREFFTNPATGTWYKQNELIKNPKLAKTLKAIAIEGSDAIYKNGSLAQGIVDEIRAAGGIITMEDLMEFKAKWGKPTESKLFDGDTLVTFPLPTSGSIINFIMNVLSGFNFQDMSYEEHQKDKLMFHRITEAFKFAFAKRSRLGDENSEDVLKVVEELLSLEHAEEVRKSIWDNTTFNDFEHYGANASNVEDHGTGHISIIAPNGDAVAITSTINYM